MRRARAAAALLGLAGLTLPGLLTLVAASHLAAHHAEDAHHGERGGALDLTVVWHGHSHARATPDHEHTFFPAGPHALPVPNPRLTLSQPGGPGACAPAAVAVAIVAGRRPLPPPGLAGVGPPHLERLSVLRI